MNKLSTSASTFAARLGCVQAYFTRRRYWSLSDGWQRQYLDLASPNMSMRICLCSVSGIRDIYIFLFMRHVSTDECRLRLFIGAKINFQQFILRCLSSFFERGRCLGKLDRFTFSSVRLLLLTLFRLPSSPSLWIISIWYLYTNLFRSLGISAPEYRALLCSGLSMSSSAFLFPFAWLAWLN